MALSMSVSGGAVNARHDLDPEYRARLQNVDRTKTKDNLILASESIEHAYERLFGEATETYNARQVSKGRPDRQIEDYAHVRDAYRTDRAKVGHSKSRSGRPAPAVEYVVRARQSRDLVQRAGRGRGQGGLFRGVRPHQGEDRGRDRLASPPPSMSTRPMGRRTCISSASPMERVRTGVCPSRCP